MADPKRRATRSADEQATNGSSPTKKAKTSLASENSDSVTGSDKTVSSGSEGVADSVQLNASKPTGVLAPTAKIAEGDGKSAITPTVDAPEPVRPNEKDTQTKGPESISPPKTGAESPVRDSDSVSDHEEKNTAPDFEEYEDAVTLTPRVLSMLTAAYLNKRLFSISMLPSVARWGRRTDFQNTERVLCDPDSNKPYLIWLVGRVSFAWFVERGEYAEKPNITIIPVDAADATLTASWLTRLAKPARAGAQENPRAVKASAYAASGLSGKKLFSQCFDAREALQAKEIMMPYPVTSLMTRDLVCLEVELMRWKPNKEGDNQYKWIEWRTKLEMKTIYLLGKSTALPAEPKTDIDFVV